jgi:sn1-specific diacylglycerol lipase
VGHSLGAGAAAVLAMLLREKYPNLFCYAYSPPGATLSYDATKYAEDFILSVVIGKDMIAR